MPLLLTRVDERRGSVDNGGPAGDVGAMLWSTKQVSLWMGEAASLPPPYC